jgi:hypothetical protein
VTLPAPPIDSRTSREFTEQLEQLLKKVYTAEWPEFRADLGASRALIEIFGRFGELITKRLNQVPEKNLLAFLDMIGASLLPPQPARVPLTFSLVNGSIVDGLVPPGTQVAAVQAEGETAPVIFETESELVVTAAQLMALFVRQPEQYKYADYSFLVNSVSADGVPAFLGNQTLEHVFYLGHDMLFSYPRLQQLELDFQATKPPASFQAQWEKWDGVQWTMIPASLNADGSSPTTDGSKYLTKDGHLFLKNVASIPRHTVAGFTQSWLRCRLLTVIAPAGQTPGATISNDQLPGLTDISMKATIGTASKETLPIEAAFSNTIQVDATKLFLPFGEKPKTEDTLYLANKEAFSEQGAIVTLNINLSSPGVGTNLQLSWEFWDGQMWRVLDKDFSDTTNAFTQNGTDGKGGIVRFTFPGQPVATNVNGVESFWIRVRLVYGNYGEESHYQLIDKKDPSKGYAYIDDDPAKGYIVVPATFKPPAISSITVSYSLTKQTPPQVLLAYNDGPVYELRPFPFGSGTLPFKPFHGNTDDSPTLYLGFSLPPGQNTFPNRKISVYAALFEFKQGENLIPLSPGHSRRAGKSEDNPSSTVTHKFIVTNPTLQTVDYLCEAVAGRWTPSVLKEISVAPGESQDLIVTITIPNEAKAGEHDRGFLTLKLKSALAIEYNAVFETYVGEVVHSSEQLELVWQYWNGANWSELIVRDYSENLSISGLIEFLAPTDFSTSSEFGLSGYWLRVIWKSGEYVFDPRLRGLLLNTTLASQAVTIKDEILGSSDGSNNQVFKTTRAPILDGQQLYVREPEIPPDDELEKLEETEGDALQVITDDTGRPKEIWVRWSQMPDFYGSGARDRHYVLDNLTGEVRFGDGQNGLIPPLGVGNIRMSLYRNGGGSSGNKPAGAITQLKTTVPYVDKVVNHLPATDGTDAETTTSLLDRAPRLLRHGQRAVTVEDYEDMAGLASPEVARAKCIPLVNIIEDAESGSQKEIKGGMVSLIIVPRSTDAKPSPGSELIARVQDFIGERQSPTAELIIAGPKFIRIDVTADVAPVSLDGASQVKVAIVQALASYLHPLTGGMDGNGWDFGRYPHVSNLYALVESIEGVDHVRNLQFAPSQESDEVKKAGEYFLVYSGTHTVNLRFGEN